MSDSLGDGTGNPTRQQSNLYAKWASGGAALSLIGEVQCDPNYPEKPGNLVLVLDANYDGMSALARCGAESGANIWPQLGHAGALAYKPISKPKGPSSLNIADLRCEAMSIVEILELPKIYAKAAKLAKNFGFGGVQIHAAHGFLFSQFLSPLFNHRADNYGGTIENRFRIIRDTVDEVRLAVGESFPIGIKINSSDLIVGGLSNEDALKVVGMIDQTSIDLIEISGGTYFPGAASSSDDTSVSGPYFVDFASRAKEVTNVPLVVTGGFKTKEHAVRAIAGGAADAVGLARAMVINPALPNSWLNDEPSVLNYPRFENPPAGSITAWYTMRLTALSEDVESEFAMDAPEALQAYDARDAERCRLWRQRFC